MGYTKQLLEDEYAESAIFDADYLEFISGSLEEPKPQEGTLLDFGLYENKHTYDWVYKHDYDYFLWMIKNVRKVHPKLKKVLKPKGMKIIGVKKTGYKLTNI
jgi:hypothetical protein